MKPAHPAPMADLFDNDQTIGPSLDGLTVAYAVHHGVHRRQSQRRLWAGGLLVLLVLNAALWLAYTRHRAVWGNAGGKTLEVTPLLDIAGEKINWTAQTNEALLAIANETGKENVTEAPPSIPANPPPITTVTPAPVTTAVATITAPAAPTATEPTPLPPLAVNTLSAAKTSDNQACWTWSFTSNAEAKRADARLAEQGWRGYASELALEPSTYMVYVGPFDSQKQQEAAIKNIVSLKIKDYSPLPSGSVSLGVVPTAEAAQTLQQQLGKRGLKGLQTIERPGKTQRTRLRFDGMSPANAKALSKLAEGVGTLGDCAK